MIWTIDFERAAQKDLSKIGRDDAQRVLRFLSERVGNLEDPRAIGQALQGARYNGLWRYRVGDVRVIVRIEDRNVTVVVLRVGHRKEIYRSSNTAENCPAMPL